VALTDDQKAMLRLLAQREEGYEDMAALIGISVEEVRERVKEALAEVAESEAATAEVVEPPPAPAQPPTPPLPPAPQPPPVVEQPPAPQPASQPTPEPAAAAAKTPAPSTPSSKRPPRPPGLKLPKDRGALIGLGAGALVLVVLVIVLIVGGGGGGSSSTGTTASTEGGTAPAASENPNLTQAVLSPVDGGDSSGTALFGRFKKNVLLQVTAEGLEPSQSGESYAIWLSHSGKAMVPVGTAKVPDSGDLAARFQIPTAVLVLVARSAFDEIDVTRTTDTTLSAAIAKARQSKSESAYTGTDVMSGKITGPFVGAAKK
jgi:outer membrane biosynthesis protein TonB